MAKEKKLSKDKVSKVKKIQKKLDEEIGYTEEPLLTPIENSEQDISKMKVVKKAKFKKKKNYNTKRIINVLFVIVMLLICLVVIDIVSVSKYNKGPFFAINTKTYGDGGTKEYYGLGYKVIKYHQIQGRRDSEVGLWNLKYYTEPLNVTDLDLAIEFEENPEKALSRYYKKFIRISGVVKSVDTKNNKIVLEFSDEGDKYTIDIECYMAEEDNDIETYESGDYVRVIGTVTGFARHSDTIPNTVTMKYCFAGKQS